MGAFVTTFFQGDASVSDVKISPYILTLDRLIQTLPEAEVKETSVGGNAFSSI